LVSKRIVRATHGDASWHILIKDRIKIISEFLLFVGSKGLWFLCHTIGGATAFKIAGLSKLKMIWIAWKAKFKELGWEF
jgi:hypothetical protein